MPAPASEVSYEGGSPSDDGSTNNLHVEQKHKNSSFFKRFALLTATLCALFMLSTVALAVKLGRNPGSTTEEPTSKNTIIASALVSQPTNASEDSAKWKWPSPSGSLHGEYKRASIATDSGLCSEIGRDIMIAGGNAVDSSIAALFCVGVVNLQSSGIGGGFIMTLYNASTQRCITLDARETAPGSSNATMFVNSPEDAVTGFRAIATPGELHGFWTAFRRFGSGRVAWKQLIEPSIQLARYGFPVSSHLAQVLELKEEDIMADEDMRHVFTDPRTGRVYEEGDILKRERLAETLEELASAEDPVKLFYKEGIAQTISAELKENGELVITTCMNVPSDHVSGGHVSLEDLASYETVIHDTPLESEILGEFVMCGPPPPSSFAVTQAIITVMAEVYREKVDLNDPLVYHRLIEAEKFAYAQRTKLGDIAFVKNAKAIAHNITKKDYAKWIASSIRESAQPLSYYSDNLTTHVPDHGTSHVSALDREGNAVSVTSSVNQILGSKRVSPSLGILWNDQMDDFSTPGKASVLGFSPQSPENFIVPGKRPMSSMSPMVIYNKNDGKVKMVVGASGGTRIISAVAQTVVRSLLFNQTVKEAVDAPRFHNQFLPHVTEYETAVPKGILENLVSERHQNMTSAGTHISAVQALLVMEDGFIHANSDYRRKNAAYPTGY
ncbi:gamma-glutamyl transpeptidase [Aphelenchoides avenae]|nr:gamma-glutamyl transpeptidase [Aphelenchus avenae]